MKHAIFYIAWLLVGLQSAVGQHKLEVQFKGVNTPKGRIAIALYREKENFLDFDKAYAFDRILATEPHWYVFENLPEGRYAIVAFFDENLNDQLDTNFIGIPKEALGTSGESKKRMGPPRFEDCSFYLSKDERMEIQLKKIFGN